jgi:hypothetical protein
MGNMVKSGRIREYDASVMVGQKFANEYVAPVASEATAGNATSSTESENTGGVE